MAHLRQHGTTPDTHLATVFNRAAWSTVRSAKITTALRAATTIMGPQVGFTPEDVRAQSMQAGGAMALLMACVDTDTIRLVRRWRSNVMLRYLPRRRIVFVSTCAMRRVMAPSDRINRVLTSSGVNPTWGPMVVVAARSAVVILALRTVDQAAPLKTAARCVSGVVPCCRRCATRRLMAATAHAQGWPVAPCPMDPPLTPFSAS